MIRVATMADLEQIEEIKLSLEQETKNYNSNNTKEIINILRDKKKGSYFLYEIEGEIIALFLLTYEDNFNQTNKYWLIQNIYVEKSSRQEKVFKRLVNYISNLAKDSDSAIKFKSDKNNPSWLKINKIIEQDSALEKLF